jgi:hypothetical protein
MQIKNLYSKIKIQRENRRGGTIILKNDNNKETIGLLENAIINKYNSRLKKLNKTQQLSQDKC